MTRNEAAVFIGVRLGAYLNAANRVAADSAGNLSHVIDDSLLAIGIEEVDVATGEPTDATEVAGYKLQLLYRALLQITRDLAVFMNVGISGDSYSLQQIRLAAEKDLAAAEAKVLAWFGTTEIVTAATGVTSIQMSFLNPRLP